MAGELFVFWGGRTAFDVESLYRCISEISQEEFFSYVNGKNDFANWLEGSLQEAELAEKIRSLSERDLILAVLSDFTEKAKAKLIIGAKESFNEDSLIREVLEKNERFLGTKSREPEKVEIKVEPGPEAKEEKSEKEKTSNEKGSTMTFVDLPKRKHSLDKEFFIGITFGMIIGILLLLIIYKLYILG